MSVTVLERTVSQRTDRARLGALVARESFVVGLVVVWTLVLALVTWGTWGDLRVDTGYDLLAGTRVADGQLPYVDFEYWYGPLSAFTMGAAFAVGGTSIGSAIALGLILAGTTIVLAYLVARRFVEAPAAGAVAALAAAAVFGGSNINFVLPHTLSAPMATILGLGTVLALTAERRRPVVAGVLLGLAAITRVEFALALYVAVGLWYALQVWRGRFPLSEALKVAVGALAIPALVYGAFLTQISLSELINVNLYPSAFLEQGGDKVLEAHAPLTVTSFVKLAGLGLMYAFVLAACVVVGRIAQSGDRARRLVLVAAATLALALLALVVARPETLRYYLKFAYGWLPLGAALVAAYGVWTLARGRAALAPGALLLALLTAGLLANSYADFSPQPKQEFVSASAYLLPIAGAFMAWATVRVTADRGPWTTRLGVAWLITLALLSGALVIHDAGEESYAVHGPGGTLHATPEVGPVYQAALDEIARTTRPGEPVLLAPQMTSLYLLAERPNPLSELSLLPGALADRGEERAAIERLAGVSLVITDRTPLDLYGQGAFGTTYARELGAWLQRDFRRAKTFTNGRSLDVWVRATT